MMNQKILLLGGTGAMGFYLVPELLILGFEVFVTTRSEHASDNSHLRYLAVNAMNPDALHMVLSTIKPDAIVDFMSYGTTLFSDRSRQLLNGTGHYCFLSSYRVFADSSPNALTERSPRLLDVCDDSVYLATDEYALAKARQEDVLRTCGKKNWTILRPCITYSRNRFQLGTLEANTICYRALQGLPVIMAREILAKQTTMTWAGDVAKMIARLVLNESTFGEDYNVVTSEHHSWSEVADCYKECMGLRVEETDLNMYAKVVEAEYQIKYDRMFDRVLDNSKVLAATGMVPSDLKSLRSGLEAELRDFQHAPYYQYPNLALNARMDRVTGTRLSFSGLSFFEKIMYWVERYPALKRTGTAMLKPMLRIARGKDK